VASEFRIGRRLVQPELNTIVVAGRPVRVEPKVMEVLVYLARRPGEVVQRETLIRDLWGDTFVTDAALTRCIAELRKLFDDDVRDPRVIQTIAKSGYRLIAEVESAGDAEQPQVPVEPTVAAQPSRVLLLPVILALAAGGILGALGMFVGRRTLHTDQPRPIRTALTLAGEHLELGGRNIAMSPDGARVAYIGIQSGTRRLFVRDLDSATVTRIPQSDGALDPFFSPDGRWLGFWSDGKLRKVSLTNLSVAAICDTWTTERTLGASWGTNGASWGTDGTILFASVGKLYRVQDSGGQPQPIPIADQDREWAYRAPEILPSGRVVLASRVRGTINREIVAMPAGGGPAKRVLSKGSWARYVATGHLVYSQSDQLWAVPFDPVRLESTGPPVMLTEGVDEGQIAFGGSGNFLYASATNSRFKLVWVDRSGVAQQVGPIKNYHQPSLSHDGRRIAVSINPNIWVYDLERETLTQVSFNEGYWPIWTPDGKRLTYVAPRNGVLNVVLKNANGTGDEEQLTTSAYDQSASSWSPDGKFLAFYEFGSRANIWLLDMGNGRRLRCFLCTGKPNSSPAFSPDGRWIAYRSLESGATEVYVRPIDDSATKYQISNGTGTQPLWSRDGRELFYWRDQATHGGMQVNMELMAVDVTLGPPFRAGKPRKLFGGKFRWGGQANYDITSDGQRFLMIQPVDTGPVTELQLVVNWFEELRSRVRPTAQ
jgi:Tol biopolymer transport system component/DNA-binding winged helix-turn-helix (wHTH) protein